MTAIIRKRFCLLLPLLLYTSALCLAQAAPQSDQQLAEQAKRAYLAGDYASAEQDFHQLAQRQPSNIVAVMYWGHALFQQQKYSQAVGPYEKARELEKTGKTLSDEQRRILTDQLAMAYGISGQLKQANALLHEAIKQDPGYPLNYYNLACAYAEEGNKREVLTNLSLAFEHKDHVLKGEKIPDPRSDSSFQKYLQDPDFIQLMNKLEGPA